MDPSSDSSELPQLQLSAHTMSLLNSAPRGTGMLGQPREIISDNAGCFAGQQAKDHHRQHGTEVPVRSSRPRGNGKVEQANGALKAILHRLRLDDPLTADELKMVRRLRGIGIGKADDCGIGLGQVDDCEIGQEETSISARRYHY